MNDFTAAEKLFSAMYGNPAHKITIRAIEDKPRIVNGKKVRDARIAKCGTFKELKPYIESQNKKGYGLFYIPNPSGVADTSDDVIKEARAVFIDIDTGDLPKYFATDPSFIFRRSGGGGYHVYWILKKPITDLQKWSDVQKQLIHFYKSDKVIHNPARLMRIPATINHKRDVKEVYEVHSENGKKYDLEKIILAHADKTALVKKARHDIAFYAKKHPDGLRDGDGRHKFMLHAVFILNDYGITGKEARAELSRVNEKHLVDKYSDEELDETMNSQKYAKNETGGVAVDMTLKDAARIETARECVRNWYYVRQQDMFFREGSNVPVSSAGFNAKFANEFELSNCARFVFLHGLIKQYENLVYAPDKGADIETAHGIDRNMYEPPCLEMINKRPAWFLDHIAYLIPNDTEREHFLNILAYIIQHPAKKVMHGTLIIGKQGIGKSILQRVLSNILGASNVSMPHNENLCGTYTGWAKQAQVVIINELMQIDKKDFNNKVKPFITEPEIEIREMYKAPYTIRNCMNIIAFSNHDNAIYIDRDDRRWFIVRSTAEKKDASYYDGLIEAMDTRSGEVLHFLKNRDLKNFRAGAEPPMTQAKKDIIEYSTSDLESWIIDGLESRIEPFQHDLITVSDIRDNLPRNLSNGYATANRISKILRDNGGVKLGRQRVGDTLLNVWAIRNHKKYENPAALTSVVKQVFGSVDTSKFN